MPATIRVSNGSGGSRYARHTLVPEAGEARLGSHQARRAGRDYLRQEIRRRIEAGPVWSTLELQLAGSGDNADGPRSQWPGSRERVGAGRLEITEPETVAERDCEVLVFDPARVTDGIELSDDPVLRFRPRADSESLARRTSS
ncbi:MAG: hypothetical protein M3018_00485 [Actinomycetota bacterium]|nr:hypothetical protein [Actinomycetota bacterium]